MEINEKIELKRIFDIAKNKKILIGIILVLFIILGFLYSYYYVVPEYKSNTTLLIIPNSNEENRTITTSDLTLNSGLISTYSNIAKNSKVLKQVISNLQLDMTESQLLNSVQVNIVKNTHIIEITVISSNPEKARDIAKELSNVFLAEIKEIYNLENIGIIDEAQMSDKPYNINHIKDIMMFSFVGIIMASAYIIILYLFDNTVKNEEDIKVYIKIKALGFIPFDNNSDEIVDRSNSKSYVAECINTIRTNILYMNATKNDKTILVTSCTPGEGKSWTSANIAVSFAEINKKVLLIDGDMRKGRANEIFNVEKAEGLSNYLYSMTGNEKKDLELGKKYIKETQIPNLHILTNGTVPPNPSELLGSNEMKRLLELLKNAYDMIIIDAPPCKLVSDSIVLSTIVDSTILVANSEKTKISDLIETKKSIEIVEGKIIGAIINKVKIASREYGNSYYYGHDTTENKTNDTKDIKKITVNEVIKNAVKNLKQKNNKKIDNQITIEEIKIESASEKEYLNNNSKSETNYNELEKIVINQNENLRYLNEAISDMKIGLNTIKKEIKKDIKNYDNTEDINNILKEVNCIKEKINTDDSGKIDNIFEQISSMNSMITNLKNSYLELSNIVKSNAVREDMRLEDDSDEIENGSDNEKKVISLKAKLSK